MIDTRREKEVGRILIIDDEESFRQVVVRYLLRQGFEVLTAADGRQGVGLAAEKLPDLIICDLIMPGMDGYEVLNTLRTDDRLADIPIIFLTGEAEPRKVRLGMSLGVDDYLTKPVVLDDLAAAVRVRLARRQGQRRRQRQELEKALRLVQPPGSEGTDPMRATFLVKTPTEKRLVKVADVQRIIAYGEYSWLYWHKDAKGALLRKSMKQWLSELPKDYFLRVHRRAIINVRWLDRIERRSEGRMQVYLRDLAEPINVSVRLAPSLNRRLRAGAE